VMVADVDLGSPDGTRTHTVEVARWFAAAGLDVDLVCRGPDPGLPGVRYHRAHGSSTGARLISVNARAVAVLWRRKGGARRCYVRHEWAQVPVLAAARALGYRVVTQVDDVAYGPDYESALSPLADVVRRAATLAMGRLATGIVAVTRGIARLLADDYHVDPRKLAVLPNGVDLARFTPQDRDGAAARAGLDPRRRYVVFIGLFADWVDFPTMLRGFAGAARDRPDAHLVLVGDGPRRPEVEQLLDELGVTDRATLTGFVRDPDRVRDLIGASMVCLLAHWAPHLQRIGASPTKLAEYFASGRPVVALALPGVKEALEESGAGIAVPDDPERFAAAIGELLDDPERSAALGAAGRRAAEERYSWESVVTRTLPLFGVASPDGAGPGSSGRATAPDR